MVSISPDLDRSIAGSVFADRSPAYSLPTRLIQIALVTLPNPLEVFWESQGRFNFNIIALSQT